MNKILEIQREGTSMEETEKEKLLEAILRLVEETKAQFPTPIGVASALDAVAKKVEALKKKDLLEIISSHRR